MASANMFPVISDRMVFDPTPMPGFIVLIRKPIQGEQVSEGGVVIAPANTDDTQKPTCLGIVTKVGEGVKNVKAGDNIVCNPWPMRGACLNLDFGRQIMVICPAEEVYATFSLKEKNPA